MNTPSNDLLCAAGALSQVADFLNTAASNMKNLEDNLENFQNEARGRIFYLETQVNKDREFKRKLAELLAESLN